MTSTRKKSAFVSLSVVLLLAASCAVEDPGPRQEIERQYTVMDFDRLEMGDGFHVEVRYGAYFSVVVRGDRRNVDDLVVRTKGNTLVVRYEEQRNRRHDTFFTITMPALRAVHFSGAVDARIDGFADAEVLDTHLSGGSVCQLGADVSHLKAILSGGSYLSARGEGQQITADLSGGSRFKAFFFPVASAGLFLSGGSVGQVSVSESLDVDASGASQVTYRGTPVLHTEVSGASTVRQE